LTHRKFAQGLALVGVASLVAIAGCDVTKLPVGTSPSAAPTVSPSAGASTLPSASSLQGRLTFALNANSNPGMVLTVGLKHKPTGGSSFSKISKTAATDDSGNFALSGLDNGDYQLVYDDEGKVAAGTFNTTGVAVSDPVSVSASQSAIPQKSLELSWDFTSAVPAPSSNLTRASASSFTFPAKPGLEASADYTVTVFQSSDTSSGAIVSETVENKSSGDITVSLNTSAVPTGDRYFVVKYFKHGGGFGAANFYGQTKPIPVKVI